jgi:putative transposase
VHQRQSARHAQRFLSSHDQINNLFQFRRDHVSAREYRDARARAMATWAHVSGIVAAA